MAFLEPCDKAKIHEFRAVFHYFVTNYLPLWVQSL